MFTEKISAYPFAAWLFTAMSAPLMQVAGQDGYLTTLLAAAVLGVLYFLPRARLTGNKLYCGVQYVWLIVLLSQLLKWSADAWPTGTGFPIVPLTLLALAVCSVQSGLRRGAGVGSILFWLMLLLYGILLISGVRNIKVSYLTPTWNIPGQSLILALLLPAVTFLLPVEKGSAVKWGFVAVGAFALLSALWTIGTLSLPIAQNQDWALYEAGKSMSFFGVAERFEAFISAAATLGYFSLFALLMGAAGGMAEAVRAGAGKSGVWIGGAVAAIFMLLRVKIPTIFLEAGTFLLWCVLPVFGGIFTRLKKAEK